MESALFQGDTDFPHFKKEKTDLSKFIEEEVRTWADQGWKPNMLKDNDLSEALGKEYSRRLKLYIRNYPHQQTVKKYIKKRSVIDLNWRELEKLANHLKKKH